MTNQARPHPRFPPRRAPSPERPGQVQPLPLQPLPEPGHLPQRPARLLPLRLPRRLQGSMVLGSPAGGSRPCAMWGHSTGALHARSSRGGTGRGATAPSSLPLLPLFPGQGLRGGSRRLLLQTLCQRRHLPAPGGGRSRVQVSAGWGDLKIWVLGQRHGAPAAQGHARCFLPISWRPGTSVPLLGTVCSRGTGQDVALVPQPCPCLTLATPNA